MVQKLSGFGPGPSPVSGCDVSSRPWRASKGGQPLLLLMLLLLVAASLLHVG